jgi:REP element-mobilizing transposase RayT
MQLELQFPKGWGGRRKRAGRKASARRSTPHRARPTHRRWVPEHVTMRLCSKSLRSQFVFPTVAGAIAAANARGRGRFQIVHYSVQADHLHLLVEALEHHDLIEGMRGFSVSLTRRINRLLFRRGRLVADRWHGRALSSPRAVRRALVYVLANAKKHGAHAGPVDPLSSAPHFRGFRELAPQSAAEHDAKLVPRFARTTSPPAPTTWLLGKGWLEHGRISIHQSPRSRG